MSFFMPPPIFSIPRFETAKVAFEVLNGLMIAIMHVEHMQLEAPLVNSVKITDFALICLDFLLFHVQLQMVSQTRLVKGFVRAVLTLENFNFTRIFVSQNVSVEVGFVDRLEVAICAFINCCVPFHVGL